jgi:flavin-binding protein dodecin
LAEEVARVFGVDITDRDGPWPDAQRTAEAVDLVDQIDQARAEQAPRTASPGAGASFADGRNRHSECWAATVRIAIWVVDTVPSAICVERVVSPRPYWRANQARQHPAPTLNTESRVAPASWPPEDGETAVAEHVYKLVELVGTSGSSVSDAIENVISRVTATVRNVRWFEVVQVRGEVADGKVARYQVALKVGFTWDEG